ncbi:MAG: outer membrane protein transport protein [Pseudomonadota bacterium]
MRRINSLSKLSTLILLGSQTFIAVPAFAAGFQINEISPGLQGAATAGSAAASNDVSAMFINPATLSTLIENQAYLGASEIFPNVNMSQASAIHTVNVPGEPPSNISATVLGQNWQNNVSKPAFVPDAYLSWRFNNRFVAGLAVVAPFGLTTNYSNNSVLRFIAQNSQVETINITPAISYAINDKWSLGLGFQAQFLQARFSNFNGPYTGISVIDALIASNNPTYVNGSSWGYGFTLGALFKPDQFTRLGAGYRSQISEHINGYGRQFTSPGGIEPAPSQDFLFNAGTSASAGVKTPGVFNLSAARDINQFTLKASVQVNFWNTFNQLSIYLPDAFATNSTLQSHWRNSWFGALGTDYRFNPVWTFRGGLAFDETPTVNGYRDPRIPDSNRVWLSLGASCKIAKNLSFDGAYTHIFFNNATVNVTQASGSNANTTVPLEVNQVQAKYKGSADIVALAVRYSF